MDLRKVHAAVVVVVGIFYLGVVLVFASVESQEVRKVISFLIAQILVVFLYRFYMLKNKMIYLYFIYT